MHTQPLLVGHSDAMQRVRQLIAQVAHTDVNVLLLGESGTGKELAAQSIHQLSKRVKHHFVPLNCGAIPSELLESELFGHEKGAFTGAISARKGRFELAEGGTLFLDEIGDMPLAMQVKLLRVLQERTYERVGSAKPQHANVRIIAATHVNLEDAVEAGTFREDLFYRLNVFPIHLPALRDHAEDIPALISQFNTRLASQYGGACTFTPEAMAYLSGYAWPGNVRELANFVERMLVLYAGKTIDVIDLPEKFASVTPKATGQETASSAPSMLAPALPSEGLDLKKLLVETELSLIKQALDESNGIVARAADRLHIRRTTLVEKMRKYGIRKEVIEHEAMVS